MQLSAREMTESNELDELKTILNALVIPHPNGLTLRQLSKEYRENEGDYIPYQKFGFHSVPALLKSMPNMVRMIGNPSDPNSLTIFPVRNEATKHIIDLVQQQNKSRKGKKRPTFGYNRFPTSRTNHFTRPSTGFRLSKSSNTFRNVHTVSPLVNRTQQLANDAFAKPLLPNQFNCSLNNGYNPKTVLDYTHASAIKPKMTSIGEKFLNLRITKTLNKTNEQISRTVQSRSSSDLHSSTINGNSLPTPVVTKRSSGGRTLPNHIKENIKSLLTDLEGGLLSFNFEARYKYQFKEALDYKSYGFETLIDCFETLSDVMELIPTGTNSYKIMPLKTQTTDVNPTTTVITNGYSVTVITSTPTTTTITVVTTHSSQPTSTIISTVQNKSLNIPSKKPVDSPPVQNRPIVSHSIDSRPVDNRPMNGKPVDSRLINGKPESSSFMNDKLLDSRSFDKPSGLISRAVNCMPADNGPPESLLKPTDSQKAVNDKCCDNESVCSSISDQINNKAKQNFRTILAFHENGINALDFASEYEKHFKFPFDSRIWGFKTPMEMFCRLHNIFTIQENPQKEHILYDSRFKKFEKPKPIQKLDSVQIHKLRQIPDEVKARMLRLIKLADKVGLLISQFTQIYEINYESIEHLFEMLRIYDSKELFELVKHELPITIEMRNGEERALIKPSNFVTDWIVRQSRFNKYIIPITLVDTPANAVLPGESYRPLKLPEKFKPGNYEYVAAYISSAVDPQKIFIQFKGYDYQTALEKLMTELDFYDNASAEEWSVPFEFLYIGYPVVCRFPGDNNWHRARITRLHPNCKNLVTVMFVDYGGTALIDFKYLRIMKRNFLSLPIQALKVGLYGIRPINGLKPSNWSHSSRNKVLEFSKPEYPLAVTLIEKTPENHWVAICDTNGDEDVFLHSVLIKDKLAVEID